MAAHQYSLPYWCSGCTLHVWLLYDSVHVHIVTHDRNDIIVIAMRDP